MSTLHSSRPSLKRKNVVTVSHRILGGVTMSFTSLAVALFLILPYNCGVTFQINVKHGTLDEGLPSKSRNGSDFYSFYGIPFAKPPLGDLRFAPPQEPDPWTGVRDTKTPPPVCIQTSTTTRIRDLELTSIEPIEPTVGEEDCLYLNVFTPYNGTASNPLPVVIFIHGGGWRYGKLENFDPMYFMDYPIVFVSFQYRLHVFGFLSAVDDVLPGNMGMKDQVAALKWVQENIHAFGGDPKRVTLLGDSSGGMSVHFHMYSPLAAGLFHRGMSLSGTSLTLGAIVSSETARDRSRALGVLLGCRGASTMELVNCLRKIPAKELVVALSKFQIWNFYPICPFAIVIEGEDVPGAFLTKNPWKQDIVHNVPWLTGINHDEGCFTTARLLSSNLWDDFMQRYHRLAPLVLFFGEWAEERNAPLICDRLQEYYLSGGEIDAKKIVKLFTDAEIAVPAIEATQRLARKIRTYFYVYHHRNKHSHADVIGNLTEDLGVCHGDDLISLLYMKDVSPLVKEGPDFIVSKRLLQYAINFIYYGDPSGLMDDKVWLPVQSSNLEYLHIRTHSDTMETNPFHERYTFWKDNILPLLSVNKPTNNTSIVGVVKTEL